MSKIYREIFQIKKNIGNPMENGKELKWEIQRYEHHMAHRCMKKDQVSLVITETQNKTMKLWDESKSCQCCWEIGALSESVSGYSYSE